MSIAPTASGTFPQSSVMGRIVPADRDCNGGYVSAKASSSLAHLPNSLTLCLFARHDGSWQAEVVMGLRFNRQANEWAVEFFSWAFAEAQRETNSVARRNYCCGVGEALLNASPTVRQSFTREAQASMRLGVEGGDQESYADGREDGAAILGAVWRRKVIPSRSFAELLEMPWGRLDRDPL